MRFEKAVPISSTDRAPRELSRQLYQWHDEGLRHDEPVDEPDHRKACRLGLDVKETVGQ